MRTHAPSFLIPLLGQYRFSVKLALLITRQDRDSTDFLATCKVVVRCRARSFVTLSNHKPVTELSKLDSPLTCIITFPLQADAVEENQDPSTKSLILVRNKSYLEILQSI